MAIEQQAPMIAARIVEYQEELSSLSPEDYQWLLNNTREAIALCVSAISTRVKKKIPVAPPVLSGIISNFVVPASAEKFIVKDKFRVDTSRKAQVKISMLGDRFQEWFINKVEDPFPGSTVSGRRLDKNATNSLVLRALGGNEKGETTLKELYDMMLSQPAGEGGDLFRNGQVNIFYIRDISDTLRAVAVYWNGSGWGVNARSVEDPSKRSAVRRVFSRYSLAA